MRAARGLLALLLAVILSLTFAAAHADDDTGGGTPETPGSTQTPEPTEQPTDPAPTPTETTPTPGSTDTTPTPESPEPSDDPTEEPKPSDGPTTEPSDPATDVPATRPAPPAKGIVAKLAALLAAPVANDDLFAVVTNTGSFPSNAGLIRPGLFGVYRNDVPTAGGDQTPNSIVLMNSVDHGTLDLDGDGGFHYVPEVGYSGNDTFEYRYATDDGESNTATVTLVVGNGSYIATNDDYVTAPDTPLVVSAPGASSNDSEIAYFGFQVTNNVDHGTLAQPGLLSSGGFTYTPDPGFVGVDTFTYRFRPVPFGPYSNTATVTIIVGDPPVAEDNDYWVNANTHLHAAAPGVLGNDTGTGTLTVVGDVAHGTLDLHADGSFDYNPTTDFVGIDSFTYRLTDPVTTLSDVATVTIEVRPVASNDAYETPAETLLTVDAPGIFADDTPSDGANPNLTDDVDNGTLTLNSDGSFTYLPDAGFVGVDTFSYSFESAELDSNEATVTITVTPVAVDDELTVPQCEDVQLLTLGNDVGVDPVLSVPSIVAPTGHGTLTAADDPIGSLVYDPDDDFVGDDTFTYTFESAGLVSNVATVTIHVTACDDGGGDEGDGDTSDDGDQALPDTGSPVSPWMLLVAGAMSVAGVVLIRRRGDARA